MPVQEAGVPLADAITRQPAVVPIVGVGVIQTFPYPCCFGIGMDIPQGIQHSPVIFWSNRSGVIPCLQKCQQRPEKRFSAMAETNQSNASALAIHLHRQV